MRVPDLDDMVTSYLIDSDWVATFLKGRSEALGLFKSLAPQGMAISLITYGEIYEGIYYGQSRRVNEDAFRQFLKGVTVLPLNRNIMRRFARIRGDLRQRGLPIGDPDILIAATALYHDLMLVTRNQSHFQRIPDLKLYQSP